MTKANAKPGHFSYPRWLLLGILGLASLYGWRLGLVSQQDPIAVSKVIRAKDGRLLRAYLTPDDKWRLPVALAQLPKLWVDATLCLEDQRFFLHPGVDPLAIARASLQNISAGQIVSGASTLTMQLARLRQPKSRHLLAKALEAIDALAYETLYSKEDILTQYLNLAPFGSNAEGVEAASQLYFGTQAQHLSAGQMAFLTLLPQNPSRFSRWQEADWRKAMARNLNRMVECEIITAEEAAAAQTTPLPRHWQRFPHLAPHFADWLRSSQKSSPAAVVTTTLDFDMQSTAEQFVAQYRPQWQNQGIFNAAVLIVDRNNRELVAAVGNQNYFGDDHGQKIPAFFVPRSPGSTLKPLLYSYSLDRGLLLPQQLLEDTPLTIAGYAPENFSGQYKGLVAAEEALSQSLNIPFVRLLQKVRIDSFVAFLESAGLSDHTPAGELGLSLILGGMETSPWALTQTYLTLASGGTSGPISYLKDAADRPSLRVLSPGAVYLTHKTLQRKDRPDYPERQKFSRQQSAIVWKTGTSQGRRDAWSIGMNDRYLVAVWTGNLDQSGSPELVGARAAAPLMFDLLEALPSTGAKPKDYTDSLTEVEICRFSGFRPNSHCPHKETVLGLAHNIPLATCPYHQSFLIERDSGKRVYRSCTQGLEVEKRVYTIPPANMRRMLSYDMGDFSPFPALHPSCKERPVSPGEGSLMISSPKDNFTYMALTSMGQDNLALPLAVKSAAGSQDVACFFNGKQIEVVGRGGFQAVLKATGGRHRLHCYDTDGEHASVTFVVEEI